MALLLAYLPDPVARARLKDAIKVAQRTERVAHEVRHAQGWTEMHELACAVAPQLAIFDPYASGPLDTESCSVFHAAYPSIPLFAYGLWPRGFARDILRLGKLGAQGVAQQGVDDSPHALYHNLNDTLACGVMNEILAGLGDRLTPELTRLVRHLVYHAHQSVTPEAAAQFCCCHPKTLREKLRAAGLPPTHHLLVWLRLFGAAHLLQDPARTVASVAEALGYSSGAALTRQLARYAGVCPTELRGRGGMGFLLKAFRRRNAGKKGDVAADRV
jgi:AraC-like DNA-binding protein